MPDQNHDDGPIGPETTQCIAAQRPPEAVDDEEKILAGCSDVNMPALLTKDVQGG